GFFFQAEDGIRDFHVTGVQTCALPISTMLGIPAEALWELIPGVTPFQIRRWKRLKQQDMATDVAEVAATLLRGDETSLPVEASGGSLSVEEGDPGGGD